MPQPGLDTVQGALSLLGPNGDHWIQGELRDGLGDYCIVGALEAAAFSPGSYAAARDAVKETLSLRGDGRTVDRWNNRATWPEVQSVLQQTASRLAA